MPKYRVDKKLFEARNLEEQLKQVELQTKYLKDEPLKRSEVDQYNKLKTGGWVRNGLITMGVVFATSIAFIIFVLLGNMLLTNGRTGNIGRQNIDSDALYRSFVASQYYPEDSDIPDKVETISYRVPYRWTYDNGTEEESDDITYTFLKSPNNNVYVDYRLEWKQGIGEWVVGTDHITGTIGQFTQSASIGRDNHMYALDVKNVNLNNLLTDWFKGQEGGWAKSLIEDFFFTAWPLTLVLWMVFILSIIGYLFILVVGIRYVIRLVIGTLRKAGYLVSEFATEVVDTVKAELPVVEIEKPVELDISEMTKMLTEQLVKSKQEEPVLTQVIKDENIVEDKPKKTEEKTVKEQMSDIFDQ